MHEALPIIARAIALAHDHWRVVIGRRRPLSGRISSLEERVKRLKAENDLLRARFRRLPPRRIAGQLARLGVKASRSSVQRILRRPRTPRPEDRILPSRYAGLLAKRPNHIWMIDFTRLKGAIRPVFVGAVIEAFSRKVLAIGLIRGEPNSRFATALLRRAIRRCGPPTWLVSDKDRALRNKRMNALLHRHGICRRYGAVGRSGSIAIIERMWRSLKQEYVRHLFLYRSTKALDLRLNRWARWHNAERPHQGLGQQTPDEVYRGRPPRRTRDLTAGTLSVRFLDGDKRLPILRLSRAA